MKRFPISWDKTLTALGFRRNVKRVKRDHYRGRHARIETLEVRAMLSGNAPEPIYPEYVFVASEDYNPAEQFTLSTEYDIASGDSKAVLAYRTDLSSDEIDIALQEIEIELRLGESVLETQSILVDIAEEEFLDRFQSDRLEIVTSDSETFDGSLVTTTVAGDFTLEELLDVAGFETQRYNGELTDSEAASYYVSYSLALEDSANRLFSAGSPEEFEAANEERHSLSSAAVFLTGRIRQDAASSSPELATAARQLRETLYEHGELAHTAFSGLGQNQVLAHEIRLGGTQEFVLALVEESAFEASDSLRVEMGNRPAMVQATITPGFASSFSVSSLLAFSEPITQDVFITEGTSSSTNFDGQSLTVERVIGSGEESHTLLKYDLTNWSDKLPETATATLGVDSIVGASQVGQSISAHWDAWGISGTLSQQELWNEGTLTWDSYEADFKDEFSAALDTVTVSTTGPVDFTVTEAVQRALLAGDSNFDGQYDPITADRRGDIEAAHLAVRDWQRYVDIFGGMEIVNNGLLYRNDINWDGVVDSQDFLLISKRLGFKGGDFNLDGVVDGYDYSTWQANFGESVDIFQQGDGNADGWVNAADYTLWNDFENETHDSPRTTEMTLRITPEDVGKVVYESKEQSVNNPPELSIEAVSELLVSSFTANDDFGWDIQYEVLNEDAGEQLTLVIERTNVAGQKTTVHTIAALSGTVGSHTAIVTANQIIGLPAEETYTLSVSLQRASGTGDISTRQFSGGLFVDSAAVWHFHGGDVADHLSVSQTGISTGLGYEANFYNSIPTPTSISAQLGRGNDTAAFEFGFSESVWVSGGKGDDGYTLGDRFQSSTSIKLEDEIGFDTLSLVDWNSVFQVGATLDLTSDQVQLLEKVPGNALSLSFTTGDEIQFIEPVPYDLSISGIGYDGAPIVVNSLGNAFDGNLGDGQLDLREALELANRIDGDNTIWFDDTLFTSGPQVISAAFDTGTAQNSFAYSITDNTVIEGPGADLLSIDGEDAIGLFAIGWNQELDVTLRGLSIENGRAHQGAGIYNTGNNLTLDSVVVRNNIAGTVTTNEFEGKQGGGIYHNASSVGGVLQIFNSTIADNRGRWGGGLYADINIDPSNAPQLIVSGSTFSGNETFYKEVAGGSNHYGGGIAIVNYGGTGHAEALIENSTLSDNHTTWGSAIFLEGKKVSLTINNSTIAENVSSSYVGAIWKNNAESLLTVNNSIVAENTATGNAHKDFYLRGLDNVTIQHSLIGPDNSQITPDPPNDGIIKLSAGQSAGLLTLGNYGGSTATHALEPDSPAINAGDNLLAIDAAGSSLIADQRGDPNARIVDNIVDIGAYEAPILRGLDSEGIDSLFIYGSDGVDEIVVTPNAVYLQGLEGVALPFDPTGLRVHVYGGAGDDTITLLPGVVNAFLHGQEGDDTLFGSTEDDHLNGGDGDDVLNGGNGNDTYRFVGTTDQGHDTVVEGNNGGSDTLDFSGLDLGFGVTIDLNSRAASDLVGDGGGGQLTLNLSEQSDDLENVIGTQYNDVITALERSENQRLEGGLGDDTYKFDGSLSYSRTITLIDGVGSGNDTLDFSGINTSSDGIDVDLSSTSANYLVSGNNSRLDLSNAPELENVIGTDGNDILAGNSLDNRLEGGKGDDTYRFAGITAQGHDTLLEQIGEGSDTVDFSGLDFGVRVVYDLSEQGSSYEVVSDAGRSVNLNLSTAELENVVGTQYNDILVGNDSHNKITGNAGDDLILGNGGNDALIGGLGSDTLIGNDGDDIYVYAGTGDLGQDLIVENLGEGSDTFDFSELTFGAGVVTGVVLDLNNQSSDYEIVNAGGTRVALDLSLSPELENAIGTTGNDTLTGNALDNRLEGGDGDDTYRFIGTTDQGHDTIIDESSSGGSDTLDFSQLDFGVGIDVNLLASSGAAQQVVDNGSEQLTLTLERANRMENVVGTVYDDSITANSASNRLEGGLGNDTYKFGSSYGGTDTIVELVGEGTDTLDFSTMLSISNSTGVNVNLSSTDASYSIKSSFRFDMSSSPELENIIGSNRNDTLTGNSLGNHLAGGLGDDTYLFSGTDDFGHNTIFEQIGEGSDTIDFSALDYGVGVVFDLREQGNNYEVVNDAGRSILLDLTAAELENITGSQYNDVLIGDAGNNRLEAGEGWDTLAGGEGDDTYLYVASAKGLDKIVELVGEGNDTLDFSELQFENSQDDGVFIDLSSDTITYVTGPWWDSLELDLSATPELENVIGSSHADLLIGNALDNRLEGGQGDDTFGFWGNIDQGHDTIIDSSGIGTLNFSLLDLGSGVAIDLSDSSATQITIGTGSAQLSLDISGAHSRIENLVGTPYDDTLIGNSGANFLDGGGGNDILEGKSGNDTYSFSGNIDLGTDTIIEATGGNDTLDFSNLDFGVGVNVNLAATGTAEVVVDTGVISLTLDLSNAGELENVIGTDYGDTFVSNSLDNRLEGQSGNDTYVYGGTFDHGRDTIIDQIGLSDTLDFSALDYGAGIDLSLVSQTWATPVIDNNGQTLKIDLSDASIDRIIGTDYSDAITAGDWDSTLEGGLGDDTYRFAGVGARAIANGLRIDTAIVELAGEGNDTIDMTGLASGLGGVSIDLSSGATDQLIATKYASDAELRFDLSSAVELENVRGTNYADTISGNTLDNRLEGAGGSDTYVFKGSVALGYDAIIDSSSQNTIDFSGADFGSGIFFDLAQGIADYTVLKDGTDRIRLDLSQANLANIIGTIYDDTLVEGASGNRLEGREGEDLIVGGIGSDTYVGGAGADVIELPTAANSNQIEDTSYHLRRPEFNSGAYTVLDLPADIANSGIASAAIGQTILIATVGHTVDDMSSLNISFSGVALSELSVSPDGSVLWTAGGLAPGRALTLVITVSDAREQLSTVSISLLTINGSQASAASSASTGTPEETDSVKFLAYVDDFFNLAVSPTLDAWTFSIGDQSVSMIEPGVAVSEIISLPLDGTYSIGLSHQGSSKEFAEYGWETGITYWNYLNPDIPSDVVIFQVDEEQTLTFGSGYEHHYSAVEGRPVSTNTGVGNPDYQNLSGGIDSEIHIRRVDIDVEGLSDEGEMSGDGILDLNEHGYAKITVHAIPGIPEEYGGIIVSGGELYRNSDGTDLVEGVISATETHTFYAKGPGTVITATYQFAQGGIGTDSVTLSQNAIVIGIGGSSSGAWLSGPNSHTTNGRWNSHVRNFVDDSYAIHKAFINGPAHGITGSDAKDIHDSADQEVLALLEKSGDDVPVAIVGFSRGGIIALKLAGSLSRMGIYVDYVGLYDPVDRSSIGIVEYRERLGENIGFVAMVSILPSINYDYGSFGREGLHDDLVGVVDAILLLPASHGALGGTPGYHDSAENDSDGYGYSLDVHSSIQADEFIRGNAISNSIVIPRSVDYGFPLQNPNRNNEE